MTSTPGAQAGAQGGEPSQEEMQAYLESVRNADPAEIVAQAFTVLGTGAEVKLGRSDARVLIDAMGALAQATEGRVPAQLTEGMKNGLTQLQMAQVEAERQQPAQQGAGAGQREQAPAGAAGDQAQKGPQQQPQPSQEQGAEQRMTDRLWIPGRDQPGT